MDRTRRLLGAACLLGAPLVRSAWAAPAAERGVTDKEILIGQSLALTGPLSEIGREWHNGATVCFDAVNERGGVHGRRIRVITLDDGYDVATTVRNVRRLVEEDQVFALFNVMGTGNTVAILPIVEKAGIPCFSPYTGADAVREPPRPMVFNVRASYGAEAEKLVQHLVTIGIRRIGVLHLTNSFGKEGLAAVERALGRRSLQVAATASIETDSSDVQKAVARLAAARPEALILVTAGKPTIDFIKAYNRAQRGMQFYTLSVMGSQSNIRALGPDGIGVVVASVVPFPWSQASPLTKEYQAAMRKGGFNDFSFPSLESYINARVLVDALRAAGRDLTRARLVAATEKLRADYGGFEVSYAPGDRQGSRFVELTIIGTNGRFTK